MSKKIIPGNTKAGRALKVITRIQIAILGLAVVALLVDMLPAASYWVSGIMFPVFSMIVIPIGFQIIALSVLVEIIIIISALVKKRK